MFGHSFPRLLGDQVGVDCGSGHTSCAGGREDMRGWIGHVTGHPHPWYSGEARRVGFEVFAHA